MNASKKNISARFRGLLPIILFSVLAMEVVVLSSGLFATLESSLVDLRMRWRYHLTVEQSRFVRPDITLVAIDSKTQEKLGRFGAGQWLARTPFCNQVAFFEEHFKPTVLAYDILFQDIEGSQLRQQKRVSASPQRLKRIADELQDISRNPENGVSSLALLDINRFSLEQGNRLLENSFTSFRESRGMFAVGGAYLRGGSIDQNAGVTSWSRQDIVGSDPAGTEESGDKIPYLRDISVPASDIHFASRQDMLNYGYSINASLASRELLDCTLPGIINGPRDQDSIVRRVPMVMGLLYRNPVTREEKRMFLPSFSLLSCLLHLGVEFPLKEGVVAVNFGRDVVVRLSGGNELRIPIDANGCMYLNFTAKMEDFNVVSFSDVAPQPYSAYKERRERLARNLRGEIDRHLVMIAVSATAVDIGNCPIASNVPLVYVHLTAANNILGRNFVSPPGKLLHWCVMGIVFVLFTLLCHVEKSYKVVPASLVFIVLYLAAAYAGVHNSWFILPVTGPVLYVILCSFSVLSYRFFTEERAKKLVRNMFSRMVSGKVLSYLEENPGSLSLHGHKVEATIFFSDLEGFTAISERLRPEQLTRLLNTYLTPVSNCILDQGGYLDKYVGDGVMAVWGAPYPDPEHAVKACRCALEQQRIVQGMRAAVRNEFGVELRVRMGLASGVVTAGNMGSEKKFQYTVLGDVVNLAARLEPTNKDFGTGIIVSEATWNMVRNRMAGRLLARIVVAGKSEIVPIYELVGEGEQIEPQRARVIAIYSEAIRSFHAREWDNCIGSLNELLAIENDKTAELLKCLAVRYKSAPPDAGWRGEYVRSRKD